VQILTWKTLSVPRKNESVSPELRIGKGGLYVNRGFNQSVGTRKRSAGYQCPRSIGLILLIALRHIRERAGLSFRDWPQRGAVNFEEFADAALGLSNLAVYQVWGQVDELCRKLG
jgi:hypothetical protein